MRSFVVCYPQRVRESSEQKIPCSLAPGCFGQTGRRRFQHSATCTNTAHIFGELWLIKQMPLMIIFYFSAHLPSLPSRGAWIEITWRRSSWSMCWVAPLAGSVDRNAKGQLVNPLLRHVAPLAGSVDRNLHLPCQVLQPCVAPLAGSVDRNSPLIIHGGLILCVAPLAGSVDRNGPGLCHYKRKETVAPLAGSVDRNR